MLSASLLFMHGTECLPEQMSPICVHAILNVYWEADMNSCDCMQVITRCMFLELTLCELKTGFSIEITVLDL